MSTSDALPSPYRGRSEYFRLRPGYDFEGSTADDIGVEGIHRLLNPTDRSLKLADCGSGAGQIWRRLDRRISDIIAVEPNRPMHCPEADPRARYVEADGLEFLATYTAALDLISWMWSLNYAVLQYFESYDATARRVRQFDWNAAEPSAIGALERGFARLETARLFVMFFDSESTEQKFITDIWSTVAPFPFNHRSYTRTLAFGIIEQIALRHRRRFTVEHRAGFATYPTLRHASDSIMNFHLRGHFGDDPEVTRAVEDFCQFHHDPSGVRIPAGVYLCWVE